MKYFFQVRLGSERFGGLEGVGCRVSSVGSGEPPEGGTPNPRDLRFSRARAALLPLQQAFMRVIILAGFFLRESWAIRLPWCMRVFRYWSSAISWQTR